MPIAPDTTLILLKGVPLDNTYKDTIYFASAESQRSTLAGYSPITFNHLTYQRVNSNVVRVEIKADYIYDYNYLMFQNSAYGSKWFYAFITSVEYVNDVTSQITYELDVMQTWWFDWKLNPCYVEREHAASDGIGEHIAPEPIDLGPITCASASMSSDFDNYSIVVALAQETGGAV